ncbi:hypothetical protein [Bosea sp. (in: a-proteobacteria)]|uniref:hypothetical protein n=1 Tax=Bosea sp. (in: a-proteobacteria) TaxID=1871050 RepID=UPI002FC79848
MSENPQHQDAPSKPAPPAAFSPEDMARRNRRSVALALVLVGLVVFFFVVTLAKTGPAILNRPL